MYTWVRDGIFMIFFQIDIKYWIYWFSTGTSIILSTGEPIV